MKWIERLRELLVGDVPADAAVVAVDAKGRRIVIPVRDLPRDGDTRR